MEVLVCRFKGRNKVFLFEHSFFEAWCNDKTIDLLKLQVFGGDTVSPQQGPALAILAIKCSIVVKSTTSPLFWLKVFSDKMCPAPPIMLPNTLDINSRKKLTFFLIAQCHCTQMFWRIFSLIYKTAMLFCLFQQETLF